MKRIGEALSHRVGAQAILVALTAWMALAPQIARAQEPAESADDFVERIGVCTHWSYADTPYGKDYDKVKQLLGAAGIRHVRDGFDAHETDLYEALGIKTTVIFSPPDVQAAVGTVRDNLPLIDMVEGPNEVDLFPKSAEYGGAGFPVGPRRFQKDLYDALKADTTTAMVGVIAPSVGRPGSNVLLRPIEGFDYLVMHSYAGGAMPSRSLESDINNNLMAAYSLIPPGRTLKPIVVTESGYHTAVGGAGGVLAGTQAGVSEKAQAKYLLRHFATYFDAGIARTFTYEFVDEFADYATDEHQATNAEACFGMIKHDLTPKPAYTALKTLIALLTERTWNARRKQWVLNPTGLPTPPGVVAQRRTPGSLDYTLEGAEAAHVRHVLLQKQTGDYYLLLWQEVPSFDLTTKTDIAVAPALVTLHLKTPFRGGAVYDPMAVAPDATTGTANAATDTPDPTQIFGPSSPDIVLAVPDSVIIVQISPKTPFPASPLLTRVDTIATTATATTTHLTWHPYGGVAPAGYFVSRLGHYLGKTTAPAFDDSGLRPGTGYPYTIRAYTADGSVGPSVNLIATTKSAFPDLTVTDVGIQPAHPKPGEAVTFTATIANVGTAGTPGGVTLGVAFAIDGKAVNWSDTFQGPLGPGETRTVTANNGPGGKATFLWPAAPSVKGKPATHVLRATVDDVNRVDESDETNNALEKTVGGAGGGAGPK